MIVEPNEEVARLSIFDVIDSLERYHRAKTKLVKTLVVSPKYQCIQVYVVWSDGSRGWEHAKVKVFPNQYVPELPEDLVWIPTEASVL